MGVGSRLLYGEAEGGVEPEAAGGRPAEAYLMMDLISSDFWSQTKRISLIRKLRHMEA